MTATRNSMLGSRARQKAALLVAKAHPAEFRQALDEERARLGLPPVGVLPLGRPPVSLEATPENGTDPRGNGGRVSSNAVG